MFKFAPWRFELPWDSEESLENSFEPPSDSTLKGDGLERRPSWLENSQDLPSEFAEAAPRLDDVSSSILLPKHCKQQA